MTKKSPTDVAAEAVAAKTGGSNPYGLPTIQLDRTSAINHLAPYIDRARLVQMPNRCLTNAYRRIFVPVVVDDAGNVIGEFVTVVDWVLPDTASEITEAGVLTAVA
ncbi:hypothetical protein HJC99_06680 [Candidatus Saccharibacteria bacterium]|nr:hypothetical protein [Candidatus Saccharibacteria bacterium]